MHIPKTAGSSVVHAFRAAWGDDACAAFATHIDADGLARARFVSGHVHLRTVPAGVFAFTFLRHPLAQLVSHLRQLDRYSRPGYTHLIAGLSPGVQAIVERVRGTDFGSAASLAGFFDWLPVDAEVRLVNIQSEVLAGHRGWRPPERRELARAAIGALPRLGFVGLTERLEPDLRRLFRMLGVVGAPVVTRQNVQADARPIDVRDRAVRAVLAGQVGADLVVYRRVWLRRFVSKG